MGGSNSKTESSSSSQNDNAGKPKDYGLAKFRSAVEDEVARRMMLQREIQMAVQVAKARDTIQIFGTAWATLVTGAGLAQVAGHRPPPVVAVPIVIGALVLGNMADMAYGNKLTRVTKEAEYLMAQDRGRFVPMNQAPFFKFYTETEKADYYDNATAVGGLFPNRYLARPHEPSSE